MRKLTFAKNIIIQFTLAKWEHKRWSCLGSLNAKINSSIISAAKFFLPRIFRPCTERGCFSEFNLKYICILETNASDRFSEHVKDPENDYPM